RLARSLALTAGGAIVVTGAQALSQAVQLSVLGDAAAGWPLGAIAGTSYFRASLARIVACAGLVAGCIALARRPDRLRWWVALLGTSYGVMVLAKVAVLGGLLFLGAANFVAVRRLPEESAVSLARMRRFVEVEVGLGLTVLFVAASLTSLPPAQDVVAERAPLAEVAVRFTPRWPALTSPTIADMPVDDRNAPRTAADRAWSEFNHHVAGFFVLGM